MTASPQDRWYVVQTQARKERVAIVNLERQSFKVYCPTLRRTRRHARKFHTTCEALFPGYVFISLVVGEQPWRSINGTHGVCRLLTDERGPVPLAAGLLEDIRLYTQEDGAPPAFEPGQQVKLRTGPFANHLAHVVSMDAQQRVRVLLDIMSRPVMVRTDAGQLEPVLLSA